MGRICALLAVLLVLAAGALSGRDRARAEGMVHPIALGSIRMFDARAGWGTAGNAIYRTSDGGHTWHDVLPRSHGHIATLAPFFLSRNQAWIATATSLDPEVGRITVYGTADGGRSWRAGRVPVTGTPGYGGFDFIDGEHGWLRISEGLGAGQNPYVLMRTNDGGLHWSIIARNDATRISPSSIPACNCTQAITFRDRGTGWATGNPFAYPYPFWLWRTDDGGLTWRRQQPRAPRGYASATTEPPVFAAGHILLPVQLLRAKGGQAFQLLVSTDGGHQWAGRRLLPLKAGGIFTYSVLSGNDSWVSDGRALYRTTDGGRHWAAIHPRLPRAAGGFWTSGKNPAAAGIDFVSSVTGFALGVSPAGANLPYLLRTDDGGRSWSLIRTLTAV